MLEDNPAQLGLLPSHTNGFPLPHPRTTFPAGKVVAITPMGTVRFFIRRLVGTVFGAPTFSAVVTVVFRVLKVRVTLRLVLREFPCTFLVCLTEPHCTRLTLWLHTIILLVTGLHISKLFVRKDLHTPRTTNTSCQQQSRQKRQHSNIRQASNPIHF